MKGTRATFGLAALLATGVVLAQSGSASLSGVILAYDGAPVPEAPVRAFNAAAGAEGRAFSDSDGRYRITGLAAGNYALTIEMPCCAYAPYTGEVVVNEGQDREFDIQMAEGSSLNVLGDDPGTINYELRNQQAIPDLPVPRQPDGRPDFSGVWLGRGDPFPVPADAQAWAQELADERAANAARDHPHTRCLPSELPVPAGATPTIGKFLHSPELLVILFEDVVGYRQIFIDGRSHPEVPNPSWMGHSVGRWEGDTLVVDTVGFNDRGWTGLYPRTMELRTTERITRTEYGYMEIELTVEDPGVFTAPWTRTFRFDLAPQVELLEYVCENNKWDSGAG